MLLKCAAMVAVLISIAPALAAPVHGQTLKEDRFSYILPKGWIAKDTGILKFRAALGPPSNGFAPNIIVIEEPFTGTLEQYVNGSERSLAQTTPGYRSLAKSAFTTSEGLRGVKLVTNQVQSGRRLRTTFYFFPSRKDRFFVVTCSALLETGSKWAATFDSAMRTFRAH